MQLYYKSTKRASPSNHFFFIAFLMLSVRSGSAQMVPPTPDPQSRFGQKSGFRITIFFGIFSAVFVLVMIAIAIGAFRARQIPSGTVLNQQGQDGQSKAERRASQEP